MTAALPGARGIVIGDSTGHVHILPAGAGIADVQALNEEISYVGHTAEVQRISVDGSGALVASLAADNTIRVWETDSGMPLPWTARMDGELAIDLGFSPDTSTLSVLHGNSLTLLDVVSGDVVVEFDLGEQHASQSFAADDRIFVGSEGGVLRQIGRDADGKWSMQQLWRGERAVRQLAQSPRGNYLVIVDDTGTASLFVLAAGDVGEQVLEFPGPVEEIAFGQSSSRVWFRTARWVHRVSLSNDGLRWNDAVFAPKPLQGARIVFGSGDNANRAYVPAARNGFVELVELAFPGSSHPGLFGNRQDLLAEWRARLGRASTEPEPN